MPFPTLASKTLIWLLAATLTLTGCSRMNLAYRNLDLLIPWTLNDYLDMTGDQQKRFRAQLRDHLGWHCRTQLPGYLDTLARLQGQVRDGQLDEAALREHYAYATEAVAAIAEEITPTTAQLLADLDDDQVGELSESLEEDRREREEKYLGPSDAEQIRERADRMRERVERWTGTTDAQQRQRILQWAHAVAPQTRLWLENRAAWQQALRDALDRRHEPGFDERVARLLQDREAYWTPAYRAAFPAAEKAAIDLFSDLYRLTDAKQRRHIDKQLQDLRNDLGSLDCLPAN